jgi:hypothetical protein
MQLVPFVVQLLEIKLHEEFDDQFKLLQAVYGKQAPFDKSALVYPAIQRHGPSVPLIHPARTIVLPQDYMLAQNPLAPAVQLVEMV